MTMVPSQLQSSFASAAAGQNRDPRATGGRETSRGAGTGSGEWSRSNGTRTFRRASTTPFGQTPSSAAPDSLDSMPPTNRNSGGYDSLAPARLSKDDLLEIFKNNDGGDPSHLFEKGWNPVQTNGSSRGWGKDSQHVPQDPTVCWDASGGTKPISFEDMTPEEREMFTTDVNSTLKIPQQALKDGQNNSGQNGRKTSVSMGTGTNFSMSSPSTASRPGTRRRETADTNPFQSGNTASPTTARFSRDDWLPRRNTELRESITDEPEEDIGSRDLPSHNQPFGLTRANTAGSAAFTASSSLWAPSPSATTPSGIGAFGSFSLNTQTIGGEKRFNTGTSRLAHLIPKESTENISHVDPSRSGWRPRQRTDTDPFGSEGNLSGSAVLGGAQDFAPPIGSHTQRAGIFDTPAKGHAGDFGMSGLNLGGPGDTHGPHSPSETNPYRSPLADRDDANDDDDMARRGLSGMGTEPPSYSTLPRSFGGNLDGSDRSQTSSVGAKGFPSVNTMTGWPAGPSTGTPDRERQPFSAFPGGGIFGPLGDLQSPGLGGLGSVFAAPGNTSTIGRGSKLGSLFPAAMQAQMHGPDQDNLGDSAPDLRHGNPLGAIGRGPIGNQARDTGSPVRSGRGAFEDPYLGTAEPGRSFLTGEQSQPGLTSTAAGQSFLSSFSSSSAPSDPAATGMKMMVMPDRMRWVYLDPQGTMQGPFNGLEMNDWYKANFFTPDLRVRRLEDVEFEPLGQLIRRIGNSREPFLVPQMGVPHGPAPSVPYTAPGSEAVPPLQNAFPSFGRTLTAAQQNDLERRKQEEQLFHARQREFAQHHQPFARAPLPGVTGSLHHHSSVHSLQSQPSFGSMTSPIGMAPQPPIGPLATGSSFFDGPGMQLGHPSTQSAIGTVQDLFNPDLSQSERQVLASMQGPGTLGSIFPPQSLGAPGNDGGLRSQLPGVDQLQKDAEGFSSRLEEFNSLRAQHDAQEAAAAAANMMAAKARVPEVTDEEQPEPPVSSGAPHESFGSRMESAPQAQPMLDAQPQGALSLTERVMRTQADAAAAASNPVQQPTIPGLPLSFPPPQSATPIAAPTAQRPASNLPTRYDDRSSSGTPDTSSEGAALAPPPTAPWAPQPGTESHKGPSLKEIQEAEAKKAAKKEEAAAAARRIALEQEAALLRERERAAVSVLGLPATSTWGTGSPVSTAAGSAWKQPAVSKGAASSVQVPASSKKTLADIQREEEVRKQKAMAAVQTTAMSAAAMGKRYADLASKSSNPLGMSPSPAAAATASGWSTVGAGGKVKIPTGPAAQTRAASVGTIKTPAPPAATRSVSKQQVVGLKDAKGVAMEEFKKWLYRELGRGLIGVADIDYFASTLLEMPLEPGILSEAVYQHSTTMDGRHFAEEFVRRKKLADRGMFDKEPVTAGAESKNSGGWNEVAKKGGSAAPKEDTSNSGFRVVPAKKGKGKKN